MADSRETGLRVGAGYNQAAMVASQLAGSALLAVADIPDFIEGLAQKLISSANDTQGALLVEGGFAGTTTVAAPSPRVTVPLPADGNPQQSAPVAAGSVNEHTSSGSTRPIKLAERKVSDNIPDWLLAQAAAKGVTEVWDNRDKPNYIAAIGKPKTPPPFRSATDGSDTSFWPPK